MTAGRGPAAAWLLTDGKIGDEVPCRGVAEAMGLDPEPRVVAPRRLFVLLAPRGPVDPADPILTPPWPQIAFASGRRTVPYLRALKRASPDTFVVFLKDPRVGAGIADVLWVAAHDVLRASNVVTSATAPHTLSAARLAELRRRPDPRVAALPAPLVALLIGGRSRHHPFGDADRAAVVDVARRAVAAGAGLAVTGSRRTPAGLLDAVREAAPSAFVWDGLGENPYPAMLALADHVVVTEDSTNMTGEAVASAAPVHILTLRGGHPRLTRFVDGLVASGRVRRWGGALERWPVAPVDATPAVAAEIARRYQGFRASRGLV